MSWRRTSDERRRWNDRRVAQRRCSDRDSATLEARNLSEHWTSRVAERALLSDGEVVCKDNAQHPQAAAAHDARQLSRLGSMPSSPPAVCKNFKRLVTV